MTNLYPNTFQHPNIYIDKLAYFLTAEENTVLTKAVREILGWCNDDIDPDHPQKRIARSVFIEGKFRRDMPKTEDNRLCFCNLSTVLNIFCCKSEI